MAFSLYRRPALNRRNNMSFSSWLRNTKRSSSVSRRHTHTSRRQRASFCPRPEALEDRWLLSGYQQTNLVSYQPGIAHFTDPNLNGWGMVSMPDGSFCVANPFNTGLATFYDRSGHVLPQTITVPASAAHPFGLVGQPTGVVYNPTSDFVISANGKAAPATLIFDSIDGTISGWNPTVDPTNAITMLDHSMTNPNAPKPALYTGLEIVQTSNGPVLYAADINNDRVEMYGGSFNYMNYFTDSTVTGFGAWSVQAVNNKLYVTFANPFAKGSYGGVVDEFDTDGNLLRQFAANAPGEGPLQNPWGIIQAPANFGAYSNDLLIGNVAGAGNINAFDPSTGAYLGHLDQPDGTPIAIKGLWDLEFGDGTPHGGKPNQLFFDAGPNAPGVSGYGLFGVIRAAGDGGNPVREVAAPSQPVQQTLIRQQVQVVVQPVFADRQFAGAAAAQSAQLPQALVSIEALPASDLAEAAGSQVWISPSTASWGWDLGAPPTARMHLRWVLAHEFGYALGWSTATTFRM
jgi:uncharacterized protein (TIGR03118 family)